MFCVCWARDLLKISVAIYVKNASATISRAIDSVSGQSYPNFELVVVDGASTDGTTEILQARLEEIDELLVEPDEGPVYAANKALAMVSGDIIIC